MPPIRLLFPLSLSLLLSVSAAFTHAAAPARPNIVFILADDLGYMDIGANNPHTFYETPNIERLAKRGMTFTNAYSSPICSPTRASIISGQNAARQIERIATGWRLRPVAAPLIVTLHTVLADPSPRQRAVLEHLLLQFQNSLMHQI